MIEMKRSRETLTLFGVGIARLPREDAHVYAFEHEVTPAASLATGLHINASAI
jgi:hypothetical protein